jgi:hypothetical protein
MCNIWEERKNPIDDIDAQVRRIMARRIGIKKTEVTNIDTIPDKIRSAGKPKRIWESANPSIYVSEETGEETNMS